MSLKIFSNKQLESVSLKGDCQKHNITFCNNNNFDKQMFVKKSGDSLKEQRQKQLISYKKPFQHQLKLPSISAHKPSKNGQSDQLLRKEQQMRKKTSNDLPKYSRKRLEKAIPILDKKERNKARDKLLTEPTHQELSKLSRMQQQILMQIRNLDVCIDSNRKKQQGPAHFNKTSLVRGYIFLNQVNDFVVEKFHQCLTVQSEASQAICDGFEIPKIVLQKNGAPKLVGAEVINKVTSINNRMLDRSLKNIESYDDILKRKQLGCRREWSLVRRLQGGDEKPRHTNIIQSREASTQNATSQWPYSHQKTFSKKAYTEKSYQRPPEKMEDATNKNFHVQSSNSKLSYLSKQSLLRDSTTNNSTKTSKRSQHSSGNRAYSKKGQYRYKEWVKTQPSSLKMIIPEEELSQNQEISGISKKDVRKMLSLHKPHSNHQNVNRQCKIASIWIPPSSYPQFFGLFGYKIIKRAQTIKDSSGTNPKDNYFEGCVSATKQVVCHLTKYFFYKFNRRESNIFDAILDWISNQLNVWVDLLEIVVDKASFKKEFERFGWVLKFWESHNRVKAVYERSR